MNNVTELPRAERKPRLPRKTAHERVPDLCWALASFKRLYGPERKVKYGELAQAMGYSGGGGIVCNIVAEATQMGLIKRKPFKVHGLDFTTKGLRRYMPDALPAPPPTWNGMDVSDEAYQIALDIQQVVGSGKLADDYPVSGALKTLLRNFYVATGGKRGVDGYDPSAAEYRSLYNGEIDGADLYAARPRPAGPELVQAEFAEVDEEWPPDRAPLADEKPQEILRETVDLAEPTLTSTDYYHASDAQLILELIERGYTVSKR